MTKPHRLKPGPDLARIKLLTCDIDGVLTDGGLFYLDDGRRMVRFHVLDGQGLKRLQKGGVKICFISQSTNTYIKTRAKDLGVDYCFTGIDEKSATILALTADLGISMAEVAHIADDINDISLLKKVGIAITVPNAVEEVKSISNYITKKSGGNGAVRELCECILKSKSAVSD